MARRLVLSIAVAALAVASAATAGFAGGVEPAGQAATGKPRLYSGVVERGGDYVDVFKVRPRTVS